MSHRPETKCRARTTPPGSAARTCPTPTPIRTPTPTPTRAAGPRVASAPDRSGADRLPRSEPHPIGRTGPVADQAGHQGAGGQREQAPHHGVQDVVVAGEDDGRGDAGRVEPAEPANPGEVRAAPRPRAPDRPAH